MEKTNLPNSTGILILGIASIITVCCYGVIGIVLGVIGLVLAKKAKETYLLAPENYKGYSNVTTGRILCIIGLVLNLLFIIVIIGIVSFIGWDVISNPELLEQRMQELQ